MKYYGLVDTENIEYGFVEENDFRITDKFIEITDEYHQQLLEEQSTGLQIVSDNKTVFTANPNLYFVNAQGLWEKKTKEQYKEEQAQKEQDKINMLTMTALDFIGVLKSAGLTSQQIEDYLNANLEIKHQLQYCQNVYCGVVRQLVPLELDGITITDEMVVTAFKTKHGLA